MSQNKLAWNDALLRAAAAAGGGKCGVEVYFGKQRIYTEYVRLSTQIRKACERRGIAYRVDKAKQRAYKDGLAVSAVSKVFETTPMRDCLRAWKDAMSSASSTEFNTASY